MRLRPYQEECVQAVLDARTSGAKSALFVLATGLGKTVIASHIIHRVPGRWMVIAHRDELLRQAAQKLRAITGDMPDIEKADLYASEVEWMKSRVVVSSIQTQRVRRERFRPNEFSGVWIDEAHHAPAQSYRDTSAYYQNNPNLFLMGCTATPDRADEKALGQVFETVPFVYELDRAIDDGWLVPIRQEFVEVKAIDLSAVGTTAGDLNGRELAEVMEYEQALHGVADPTVEIAGDRRTIVFCASVAHAERLSEIIDRRKPGKAGWLCGKTPEDQRREILKRFAQGDIQFLCNVGVLTEGFDDPGVEVVAVARPTKSRALYAQMVGRGTRTVPGLVDPIADPDGRRAAIEASRKPSVQVIDFEGNSGRHALICTADILGGKYDDDVVARAKQMAKESPVDMREALDEAAEQIQREREEARQREAARRAKLVGKADFSREERDPFQVLHLSPWRQRAWDTGRAPSDKMVTTLRNFGVPAPDKLSFGEAKQLLGALFTRREKGLASFNQTKCLKKYGIDATRMTFATASGLIDQIKNNGWKGLPPQQVESARSSAVTSSLSGMSKEFSST